MADDDELGTIEKGEGYFEARLERHLDHDRDAVWAMLTEPDRFIDWLAPGEIELAVGGAARLNFVDSGIVIDSQVSACEPARLLEYSWSSPGEPERPVRWDARFRGQDLPSSRLLMMMDGRPTSPT